MLRLNRETYGVNISKKLLGKRKPHNAAQVKSTVNKGEKKGKIQAPAVRTINLAH